MPVVGGNEYDIRLRYFDDQMFGDIMLRPEWLDSDDLVIGSPIESGFSLTNSEWEVFEFVNEPAPAGAVNLRYSIVTANIFEPTNLPSERIFSTRRCIDHVFPVPGPATHRILFAEELMKSS